MVGGFSGADVVAHQPDEAGSEHGVRSGEELALELFEGGEGGRELRLQGLIGLFGALLGGHAAEEEVVVVGHGGVVEKGGKGRLAGVFLNEGLDIARALVNGSWWVLVR